MEDYVGESKPTNLGLEVDVLNLRENRFNVCLGGVPTHILLPLANVPNPLIFERRRGVVFERTCHVTPVGAVRVLIKSDVR